VVIGLITASFYVKLIFSPGTTAWLHRFPNWLLAVLFLAAGIFVFLLRNRYRLGYGVTEFLVGAFTGLRVLWPKFDMTHLEWEQILKVAAGIYIIVRGLDNIGKGLEGTILELGWKSFERANWLGKRRQSKHV
jgi:hypothetical protein